jgi:hypothetical protein
MDRLELMGPGPWIDEPDHVEFTSHGFACELLRCLDADGGGGHWCGYICVPSGHPWHGMDTRSEGVDAIEVHGGITFAAAEADGTWCLGFDAAHGGDVQPALARILATLRPPRPPYYRGMPDEYRTLGYMRAELESLAGQAHAAAASTRTFDSEPSASPTSASTTSGTPRKS